MKKLLFVLLAGLIFQYSAFSQEISFKEKKLFRSQDTYIFSAVYSPFRNFFALTYGDNTLELYDKNWRKVFEHQGNPANYSGDVVFSPDEEYLAFSRYKGNNDVAIFSLRGLKVVEVLSGQSSFITDMAYSHNGKYLAVASYDKSLRIYSAQADSYMLLHHFEDQASSVRSLSFSHDDRLLATCGDEKRILIYKNTAGEFALEQAFAGAKGYIDQVLFHPVEDRLYSVTNDFLFEWEKKKGAWHKTDSLKGYFQDGGLAFSPDGSILAAPASKVVKLLGKDKGSFISRTAIYRHNEEVFRTAFSEDGRYLCTSSSDKTAYIWELEGLKPSLRSEIAEYMYNELPLAMKKLMQPALLVNIKNGLDKELMLPKDEFETTAEYNKRREKLAMACLADMQELMEKSYGLQKDGSNIKIPLQELIAYNADREIYKIRFMETEAGVQIPPDAARKFKASWKDAYILVWKHKNKGDIAWSYDDFELVTPSGGSRYQVEPLENPFHLKMSPAGGMNAETGKLNAGAAIQKEAVQGKKVTRALMFATNVYDSFTELVNPLMDANTLGAEFSDNYRVMVDMVENPTLNETVKKLRDYASMTYTEDDQLFIFFAGHGMYDGVFKEGYVISKDSKAGDETRTSYLSHSNLRTMVNNIPCKHIFLVMDVCFGGTFDPLIAGSHRGAGVYEEISAEEFVERKSKYKTRLYLTSGGNEYVPDGRPGHHSPFMRKFLEAMRNYGGTDGIVTVSELLSYIEKVKPQPRFGEFGDNEPGSDFLLELKN